MIHLKQRNAVLKQTGFSIPSWQPDLGTNMPVFRIAVAVFLIFVDTIGILGNLAIIVTISINKRFHIIRYFLLASLAVSDAIFLVLVVPFQVASNLHEDLALSMGWCKANAFMTRAWYCSTTLHLIAVSFDRYLAIVKSPLSYVHHITKGKTLLLVCFVWLLPFVTAAGPLFGIWEDLSAFNARIGVCDLGWDDQSEGQLKTSIASIVFAFVVPLLAIAWLNFKVFKTASGIEQEVMAQQAQIQPQQDRRREHKAAKDVTFVLGVYLMCYLPAWITVFCRQVLSPNSVPTIIIFITNGLLFSKSAWNPIIYGARKREFREALKMMLRCKRVPPVSVS